MPELPEVEIVRRGLAQRIIGRKIAGVEVYLDKIARPDSETLRRELTGLTVQGLRRKGKVLLWDLGRRLLAVHLKMTGRFDFVAPGEPLEKHTHFCLTFNGAPFELRYHDLRRFGWLHVVRPEELDQQPFWSELGPDALEVAEDEFCRLMAARRGRLKPLLLNQSFVAGLGNIYVDETLFRAGLHPLTSADRLGRTERRKIHAAMKEVLELALKHGGSSIANYRDAEGNLGYFQTRHLVYGKADEPCPRCGATIERIKLGGRSSCFCPECQALK